jgi:hypothetical protein
MLALVSFNISRLSCPDAIIVLMFLVNSSNKCSISWTEKLQEASDSAKGQTLELVATLAEKEKEILEC